MNDLQMVNDRLNALIGNLSVSARKEMARNIAKKLRASQQNSIKNQQAPDGTPFKPRKTQPIRSKKGRVKREMFARLRTVKYMKAKATSDEAVIEFTGRVERMARIHQYGLRDRPSRNGKEVQYESRPLLGLKKKDLEWIEAAVLDSITKHFIGSS